MVLLILFQTPGKDLNTFSLYIITLGLIIGALLNVFYARSSKNRKSQLKMAAGWICWAISYIIISIRLIIPIENAQMHITLYQIILTLDAFGFSCFFFFLGEYLEITGIQSGIFQKKIFVATGWALFLVQVPFIWIVGGFGVIDTPFGVEILPSFVCQNIMATTMIVGGIIFLASSRAFSKQNNKILAWISMVLATFIIVLILHIFTTVILGHSIFSGVVLLLARIFLGGCAILTAVLGRNL